MISFIQKYGIVYVFDIHGCSSRYGFDIEIGTNMGGNLSCSEEELNWIITHLSNHFSVAVELFFKASKKETVSNYVHQKTMVNCLQMELSSTVRLVPEHLNIFLDAIQHIIAYIEERYKKGELEKQRLYYKRKEKKI